MSSTTDEAAAQGAAAVVSRVAACVEYSGTAYRGWQRQQPGVKSVQEEVEKALSRVANHPVQLFCAGRPDGGVRQACRNFLFDICSGRAPAYSIHVSLANLPHHIGLVWANPVGLDFLARV